ALRQHPQVQAAAARVDAARGMLRTARTLPNPMLSYMTEGNRFPGQGSNALFSPEQSFFASVPFDPFVRRQPRIARADADVRASEADLAAARRDVSRAVTHAFY